MPEKDWMVGIAEYKVAQSPDRLVAYGLGSCVAVSLYDRNNKIGGLAHVMLPSSRAYSKFFIKGKYADTAIEALIEEMLLFGADLTAIQAKLVGGANMFVSIAQQTVAIGLRNVSAAREKLFEIKIPILSEEVGGAQGRTILFSADDGRIEIRKLNKSTIWI